MLPAVVMLIGLPTVVSPVSGVAAAASTVASIGTALCAGNGPVVLSDDVSDSSAELTIAGGCTATLDLNGQSLVVKSVVLGTGSTLTIRDESADADGELHADGSEDWQQAGIQTTGAGLRIENGTVVARGGVNAAGIGGGLNGSGGTVEISGGTVDARGGQAGVGGGSNGSGGTITISGGTVDATGGIVASGIGGGANGSGGTVEITGGHVEATGGASGIGGGSNFADVGTVTITGGSVIAEARAGSPPIGPGSSAAGELTIGDGATDVTDGLTRTITFGASVGPEAPGAPPAPTVEAGVSSVVVTVTQPATGGEPTSFIVTASPGGATCNVSGASGSCTITGLDAATTYTFTATASNDGGTSETSSASLPISPLAPEPPAPTTMTAATLGTQLCDGGGAIVSLPDNVPDTTETLVIADDCTATLDLNGVTLAVRNVVLGAGSTLTIRDTNDATSGFLRAEGAVFGVAGIRTAGATLRVESGVVVANGGATAAGIGGDGLADRDGGTVEITGGSVEVRGGMSAAGVGGGFTGAGGTVTISGGTVDVFAGSSAAAIGGGSGGAGGTITITGGAVIAEGSGLDPIGPGSGGAPGTVTIGAGGSRCDDGLFAIIAFDGSGSSCATQDSGTGLDSGTDEDDGSGQVQDARVDGPPAPASVRDGPLGCAPAVVRPGESVECTIAGGTPGSQIAWRAAFNPVFAGDVVTLDSTGAGSFRFTVPAGAADRPIMVELVELEATVVLASEDGPVPSSVPAGQRPPVVPTWLVSLTSISLAIALLLATRVLAPGGRGARPQRSALRG